MSDVQLLSQLFEVAQYGPGTANPASRWLASQHLELWGDAPTLAQPADGAAKQTLLGRREWQLCWVAGCIVHLQQPTLCMSSHGKPHGYSHAS